MVSDVQQTALAALSAGLSPLPIQAGGKVPLGEWKQYQNRPMDATDVDRMFRNGCNIGLVCGAVSGNLECIDFDEPDLLRAFRDTLEGVNPDLRHRLTVWQETCSSGFHLLYRVNGEVGGNQPLAKSEPYLDENGKKRQNVLIETRGRGGYFLLAPSRAVRGHGKDTDGLPYPYTLHGTLDTIPTITEAERDLIHSIARSFDESGHQEQEHRQQCAPWPSGTTGDRPGDRFNAETDWSTLLTGYGWRYLKTVGDRQHWQRPGKEGSGTSGTLRHDIEAGFWAFTTSTPLPEEKPLSKFAVFTHYDHGGDFAAATLALAARYGMKWEGGQRKGWAGTSYAGAEQEQVFAAAKKCRDFGTHIPEHILKPGGLLEEFGDYVERSRAVSGRLFSLAIGIAALGALIGQKISIFNLRSNFYFLLLARSGIGKDAAQAALLALTDVESLLKEYFDNCDVTSDTAILKLLERQPVCLSVLDEVGFFFNENKNERSPGRKITQLMLKLFSSTDRSEGKRYADSRNDVILPYHHYSLVGSTTPEVIFKAFTSSDAASGLIPRCLFVAEDSEPVRPKLNTSRDGEEELARRLAEIAELEIPVVRNGNLDLAGRPVPKEIPISDDAQKLFEAFSEKAHALKVKYNRDSIKGPIYNRCFEHGAKLALVHAVSRCGAAVVEDQIHPADAAFGIELAEILTEWTAIQFEANLVDSDFAELCKRTIEVMEADLGAGNKYTTWRTIARALRRSKSDLEKALEALELRGDVGRCKHEYRPGQFTDAFQLLEDYSP